ncbi:MAG: hypothetical protein DRQ48_00165 [Gammaproteobacteria bacterium]|nr:MAG: hypothetical protein DRQ48_00165 [Gammaproteobacteria bacterium]
MSQVSGFFKYAKERYHVKLRRDSGQPAPWTKDPVIAGFRFCHIFREDDRTTAWLRENIREPLRDDPVKVAKAVIGFRIFNRITTGELLKPILLRHGWSTKLARKKLTGVAPLVTGAYMVRSPYGMNKLTGLLQYMDGLIDVRRLQQPTLQAAHAELLQSPGWGAFTSYEIICDLMYTSVLENAIDKMTWASPGPGAARGLEWIYGREFSRTSQAGIEEQVVLMRKILKSSQAKTNWPVEWPAWDMRTVEHTLCEYDKYRRGQLGRRLKRRYP